MKPLNMNLEKVWTLTLATGLFLATAAGSASAQNLISNGTFSSGDLTGWSTSIASSGVSITYDASTGNPSGSALLSINDNTTAPNADYLYQLFPVVNGQQYQVSADWSGDLLNGGTDRNWAEVYLVFSATSAAIDPAQGYNPGSDTSNIQYKRATAGGQETNPNTGATYSNPWGWQSITQSPISTTTPTDGIFTATGNYMLLAFNLGGHTSAQGAGLGYYNVDNVSVVAVPEPSSLALLGLAGIGLLAVRRFRRIKLA